jgi:hypothetical protein
MTKYILFNLMKKTDKKFEIGRTSNEFFQVLASLSMIVHLGRCHLSYDQVHIGGQGQLPENPNM